MIEFACMFRKDSFPMRALKKDSKIKLPHPHDWRTTDADEVSKRRFRAQTEPFKISNTDSSHRIFSNFRVKSSSGMIYSVEIRDLTQRYFACDCVDFRSNGLGTCKHVEAVLLLLEAQYPRLYNHAQKNGSTRIDIVHINEKECFIWHLRNALS